MHVICKQKLSVLLNYSEMHEKIVLICVLGTVGGRLKFVFQKRGR